MLFSELIGHPHIKGHLRTTADAGRVAHAQIFSGPEGSGTLPMALAYARYLLCGAERPDNSAEGNACHAKCRNFTHPDLHFAFPVATSETAKKHPVSDHYLTQWREFLSVQPYGNLFDWYRHIGIEKKQGLIGVDEAHDVVRKLSLKSYEGGYKILIVWMAERMNTAAANKLLKLIEEPPSRTVILLVCEDESQLLGTIRSRCQAIQIPALPETAIADGLADRGCPREEALKIAVEANGNFNRALDLMVRDSEELAFERWFVQWTRTAFKARGNKAAVQELILWSEELARNGRETQKNFLAYSLQVFRQALLLNYGTPELVYLKMKQSDFDLAKFAPFVHENNIEAIIRELESAIYHVERNGNARIIFTDLSITLTRLLHTRATSNETP